ncbi:27210_t:CDS:2 [Gigaspora margarita]|uniref:27210_t:CDS:1 n=1 Tax=Gigaspora margarita TaxID=4874 RepID=A0ABN7V9I9_GIGMA|nr:27210_t:CDS:2 [Gigaspora margarita]
MPNVREIRQFNIDELANISKGNRYLNSFFVYRKEYTKRATASGKKMKMTDVSKLASQAWKKENPSIKKAYTDIVFDANMTKVQTATPKEPTSLICDQLDPPNSETSFLPNYEELPFDTVTFYEYLIMNQIFNTEFLLK